MPKGKTVFVASVSRELWDRIHKFKKKTGRAIYHIVETAIDKYLKKEGM